MTVFVDTGVLYAHHDADASRHDAALGAMNAVNRGSYGQPYVSDYVYDEAVTLTRARAGGFGPAREISRRICGVGEYPSVLEMVHVTPGRFREAVDAFERYDDQSLSFTDATTVALVDHRDLDAVLSFDDDFDGLVERVDPENAADAG